MFTALTLEQNRQIEALLMELLVRAEAGAVYLCDRGGNIIAQNCASLYRNEENIAALAAGSFFATREVAALIGESEFRCVFHQGERASVFMQSVAEDLLLLVVFGRESNPGLVRLYANELCQALERYLAVMNQPGRRSPSLSVEFKLDDTRPLFTPARKIGS